MRKLIIRINYFKLILSSVIIGLLATTLAISLKKITEIFEESVFAKIESHPLYFVILPSVGITIIYFTRKYLFKGKQNKGIKEIFHTLENKRDELPAYKIPSHYINGFLTVIFGGSTGVEVSTVVAAAAIGASAHQKESIANAYKEELVCAGVAAGVAGLFGSPIVGLLFAIEVISRKVKRTVLLSTSVAVLISWIVSYFLDGGKLFNFHITHWNVKAIPFIVILSFTTGIAAVYFTKSVIIIKEKFSLIENNFLRVNIGAIVVGTAIFFFPQLFGDSYHAVPELLTQASGGMHFSTGLATTLLLLVILKPLVASLTLGAGGDGGVFAPSIVAGAFLGMLVAGLCNRYFHTNLDVMNFALMGAAGMLSAAIHAPWTALFLACSVVNGGFVLFVPILVSTFIAKQTAKTIFGYTVYTYKPGKAKLSFLHLRHR
ncbi:CIC family chloride channel protein [Mucilaginibacter yixingensis]|uniref:CIC family chloride channel protein n=1 Tax=Mucilaginibacter yixingensis TaxID=1295612 RepID=A0A2T5JAM5_9SPHI|nr:chloride channel protein [Mucilaginibacter yixingensis]PTQ97849.1 CIC family chloride channel protein [Mucilaginibacter yixingensis]